jgi:hypothetical protein
VGVNASLCKAGKGHFIRHLIGSWQVASAFELALSNSLFEIRFYGKKQQQLGLFEGEEGAARAYGSALGLFPGWMRGA